MISKSLKKIFSAIFSFIFLVFFFLFVKEILTRSTIIEFYNPSAQTIESFSDAPKSENQTTTTLIFTGDIMLDRGVELMMERNNDWKWPFLQIAPYLQQADIVFGNLEGPISDKGIKVGSIYSFRANPKAIEGLKYAGFNILSLANNHSFDYGKEALEDTFLKLKEADINYVGAGFNENESFSPVIRDINDSTSFSQVKIAFLAYTDLGSQYWRAMPESSGISWISENDFDKIKTDIQNAKTKADIVIVSLHSGKEYSQDITQFQTNFSKTAIDAGADVVIGHHPHVVQKNEEYNSTTSKKNGYIFYSLGNFVFDQSFSPETMEGEIVKIIIENKKIKEIIPIKIKINDSFQPSINNDKI